MPVAGGKESIAELETLRRSIAPLMVGVKQDNIDEGYQQYVKRIRGFGKKTKIATPQEYSEIKRRLAQIQQPKKKNGGYRMGGGYAEYMRQTAQPSLEGASGADLEEVKKALYGK